ncbi:hypothetical protein ACVWZZ_005224 [Bradyrhizobium sp. LM6.10]
MSTSTDTHTVAVKLTSATLPDGTVPPGPLAMFQSAMSAAIAAGADSKGSGTGTINWSLADLPVYLADFIPKGEVLTLVYTVTLTDAQGATSQQTITVTITGTDAAAVVWIATDQAGAPSGGFWKDAANWETGTVPTSNDDVIVITDQLHGLTPSYPVTIDTAAYAKSLTLDDYDTAPHHKTPEVVNKSTLTIGGKLTLNADAKFTNSFGSHVIVGGAIDVGTITRTPGVVVINTSTITNAGTFTLAAGGTIDTLTAIANSGTIDLSGGTLVLKSDVANTGGTVQADAGTMLIVDTATISGGTVTIAGTLELDGTSVIKDGTLNNSSAVNVKGAAKFAPRDRLQHRQRHRLCHRQADGERGNDQRCRHDHQRRRDRPERQCHTERRRAEQQRHLQRQRHRQRAGWRDRHQCRHHRSAGQWRARDRSRLDGEQFERQRHCRRDCRADARQRHDQRWCHQRRRHHSPHRRQQD